MKSLRVELRFKNAALLNLLEDRFGAIRQTTHYGIIKKAAEEIGVRYHQLSAFITLRQNPYTTYQRGNRERSEFLIPRKPTIKIAEALGVPVDVAFPPDLYSQKFETIVRDIEPSKMLPLSAALSLPAPEVELPNPELAKSIQDALGTLRPKERRAIELLMGLDDEPLTVKETGVKLHVSPERVRQIAATAMRKLRHPSRSLALSKFI